MNIPLKISRYYLAGYLLSPALVLAVGISTDGSIGQATTLSTTAPGTIIVPQSLGRLSADGNSLFHSFQEFNVHLQQNVLLDAVNSPQRIIMRVTGNNSSTINGGFGLSGRNNNAQNIFLINPNGVVIGENAAINLSGVFHYSNLPIIQFTDGRFFSAFDKAGSTLSSAPVSAFGFVERTGVIAAPMIVPYNPTQDVTGDTRTGTFYIRHLPQPLNNPPTITPAPTNTLPLLNPPAPNLTPSDPLPTNATPLKPPAPTASPSTNNSLPINATTTEKIAQAAQISKDTAQQPLLSGFISNTKINQVIAQQDIPLKQSNLIQPNSLIKPTSVFASGNLLKPSNVSKAETPVKQTLPTPPPSQQNTQIKQQDSTTTAPKIGQENAPQPSAASPPPQPPAENVPVVDINPQNKRLGLQNFEPYPCSRENSLMRVGKGGIPANEMRLGFIPPVIAWSLPLKTDIIAISPPFSLSQSGANFPCAPL